MPRDIRELLDEGASTPRKGPDMDAILRRSRTITWRRRTAAGAGAVALSVTMFLVGTQIADPERLGADNDPAGNRTEEPGIVPTPEVTTSETTTDTFQSIYEVWFAQGEMLVADYATATVPVGQADGPEDPSSGNIEELRNEVAYVGGIALQSLLDGPTGGSDTAIPEGTKVLDVYLDENSNAVVSLSPEFESGGGSTSMSIRVAQVVWTMTQFPQVEGVLFQIESERLTLLGGEGVDLSEPQTRADWMDFAPAIVVQSPRRGDVVTSPVSISGNANVFEATVSMRIADENGKVLAEDFATATCGTGCRGTYEKSVAFEVDKRQPAFVEVYSASAEDGSPMFVIRIPVTLSP